MIARFLWFASLIAIAGVTTGLQLDRQARKTPSLAYAVPEVFRSSAQRTIAAAAIETGDAELGLAQTRTLIKRRPMPARHLRLLAQAQFAAEDYEAGSVTIQYAAQRGWRDRLAQRSMLEIAIAVGDRPQAARRYAALFLNRNTDDAVLEELGQRALTDESEEEQAILAEIVLGGTRWHSRFLSRGARTMPPGAFVEIVEMSLAQDAVFECRMLQQAQRIVSRRDEQSGERMAELITQHC